MENGNAACCQIGPKQKLKTGYKTRQFLKNFQFLWSIFLLIFFKFLYFFFILFSSLIVCFSLILNGSQYLFASLRPSQSSVTVGVGFFLICWSFLTSFLYMRLLIFDWVFQIKWTTLIKLLMWIQYEINSISILQFFTICQYLLEHIS